MAVITDDPTPTTFNQLPLSPSILTVLDEIGYEHATPVQAGSIVPALEGRDLMVQSQTGTGKTAAFTLPLIEKLQEATEISALVLTPTRELARQVAQEAERLAARTQNFSVTCVYGGVSIDDQIVELKKKPTLVVGTPGRVIDHLRRRTLSLKQLQCFVLDEADEMLSMGFAEELDEVLSFLPEQRQTLLFSATFPKAVKRYAKKTLKDPLSLSFLQELSSADELEHFYMLIPGVARSQHLVNLILEVNPESALVFTNTRRDAGQITQRLKRAGITAAKLSGDMDQAERDRVMKKIKSKTIKLVVATDVAARGIDISQLSHVVHYQLPKQPEVYVHRSGRTGRAGSKGVVISLAGSQDLGVIHILRRAHHINLIERPLPKPPQGESSPSGRKSPPSRKLTPSQASSHALKNKNRRASDSSENPPETSPEKPVDKVVTQPNSSRDERIRRDKPSRRPRRSETPSVESTSSDSSSEASPKRDSHRSDRSTTDEQSTTQRQASAQHDHSENDRPLKKRRERRKNSKRSENLSIPTSSEEKQHQSAQTVSELSKLYDLDQELAIDLQHLSAELSLLNTTELDEVSAKLDQQTHSQSVVLKLLSAIASLQSTSSPRVASDARTQQKSSMGHRSNTQYDVSPISSSGTRDQGVVKESETLVKPALSASSWLYINIGWRDCSGGFSAIKELIAELGGLLPEDITQIKVKDRYSLIAVDPMFWDDLMAAVNGEDYRDKTLRIERAKSSP